MPSHHSRIQLSHRFFTDTLGLDTDTVKWTVKSLSSRLVTRKFNSPANSSRRRQERAAGRMYRRMLIVGC
eukprot:2459356-Pyramimonas_sp.AAC.1